MTALEKSGLNQLMLSGEKNCEIEAGSCQNGSEAQNGGKETFEAASEAKEIIMNLIDKLDIGDSNGAATSPGLATLQ